MDIAKENSLFEKVQAVSDLIRLPKQYGTLLLLCPTLWSLFIASGGTPTVKHLIIFVLGSFLMRSAGCAINDIADRNFDKGVERTKGRPIASGRLTVLEGFAVFLILSVLAFLLVLQLNRLTILLSLVGIGLAVIYPFVKRFSHLPQPVLGVAFGWGAVMAWSAVTGEVSLGAILIFIANIFWSTAYDTIYGLMDIEDDKKIGVKSTAILFGESVYRTVALLNIAFIAIMGIGGYHMGLGSLYFTGLAIALFMLIRIVKSVKGDKAREVVLRGFIYNAGVGTFILLSIVADLKLGG